MEGNPFNWTWTSSKSPGSDDLYVNHSNVTEDINRSPAHKLGIVPRDMEDINQPSTSRVKAVSLDGGSCKENNSLSSEITSAFNGDKEETALVNNSVREERVEYDQNKVSRATLTDIDSDNKGQNCKYCKSRLSKLRWLERVKSRRRHSLRHMSSQNENTNKSCQTSASLFEKAEMTQKELQSIAMILRFKWGRAVDNETFCKCVMHGKERDCRCGEEDKYFEWVWDLTNRAQATNILDNSCLALFHKDYSCGTAAVRGQMAMTQDQHFWEIKMTTPVYGTDMMVGIGTDAIDLSSNSNTFCSMLGNDIDSWGISYDGRIQHNRRKQEFCGRFGQGAIIGVHLDMWHGTLSFFKNRQPLGTAFTGLRGRSVYPMACSTAARSGMKIISSRSFPTSLQFMCCQTLRRIVPSHLSVLDALAMPPGLRAFLANNMTWLLHALPPKFRPLHCQDFVCSICLPLKSVLEGLTDDEDSDDEKTDLPVKLADSDNDSEDEEEVECIQPHSPSLSDFYGRLSRGHLGGPFTLPGGHSVFSHMSRHGSKRRKLDHMKYSLVGGEVSSEEEETEKNLDEDKKEKSKVQDCNEEMKKDESEENSLSGATDEAGPFCSKKRKRS